MVSLLVHNFILSILTLLPIGDVRNALEHKRILCDNTISSTKKRFAPLHESFSVEVHYRWVEIRRDTSRNLLYDLVMLSCQVFQLFRRNVTSGQLMDNIRNMSWVYDTNMINDLKTHFSKFSRLIFCYDASQSRETLRRLIILFDREWFVF